MGKQEPPANPDPVAKDLPSSWGELGAGHLVIAKETLECGWWEAIVVERTGDLVTVKYRDFPPVPKSGSAPVSRGANQPGRRATRSQLTGTIRPLCGCLHQTCPGAIFVCMPNTPFGVPDELRLRFSSAWRTIMNTKTTRIQTA